MLKFADTEARRFVLRPELAAGRAEGLVAGGQGLDQEAPAAPDQRSQTRPLLCRSPIRQRLLRPRHRLTSNADARSPHVMAVEIPAKRPTVRNSSCLISLIGCILPFIR